MAELRTQAEKAAIVRRCVEIEKAGGDVLAYLSTENYISPRATWFNLQREWLHRRIGSLKDGKPRKEGSMAKFVMTPEIREKAIEIAINKGDPREYLKECGSEAADLLWIKIRTTLKQENPERWALLPARVGRANYGRVRRSPAARPAEVQVEAVAPEVAAMEEPAAEPVTEAPKEAPKPEKKPGTVPVMYAGYTVRCIECEELGRFSWDPKYHTLDWNTPEGEEISMGLRSWTRLLEKLPEIRAILGVADDE